MSNTMTAHEPTAHEPIGYLDRIINEEEKRCEYGHQWRNFTISRSGRFKSKNKKREIVDGKLFDTMTSSTAASRAPGNERSPYTGNGNVGGGGMGGMGGVAGHVGMGASKSHYKEQDKNIYRQPGSSTSKLYQPSLMTSSAINSSTSTNSRVVREKAESYKSYYETNL